MQDEESKMALIGIVILVAAIVAMVVTIFVCNLLEPMLRWFK
jgi:hypothetical protein